MAANLAPKAYKACLVRFMGHKHGTQYAKDAEFTQEQLTEVTADDLLKFMSLLCFGTIAPTRDDRPTKCRSTTLEFHKKAISCFMPNKNHQWNELTNSGNPTKSQVLNDLIQRVRRFEARKQGVPSQARRPLRMPEFKALFHELRQSEDMEVKHGVPAFLCFQSHVIGRADDCCKWHRTNLAVNDTHPRKAARFRLAWSKNVTEERDAPWQHLFGCMDWVFCCLMHIGLWLELHHATKPFGRNRPFVFLFTDDPIEREEALADKSKEQLYKMTAPIMKAIAEEAQEDGKLGGHSVRKFSSTLARLLGMSKDHKDHRGRWKNKKRVSDAYDDTQLDYVDAKVAATLCPGGVCHCEVVDPGVTGDWLAEVVCPNVRDVFGQPVAVLFGKAVMWLAFSQHQEHMPTGMRERIHAAYQERATIADGENPIRRRLVVVTGNDARMFMEDVPIQVPQQNNEEGPVPQVPVPQAQQALAGGNIETNQLTTIGMLQDIKFSVTELTNSVEIMRGTLRRHDRTVSHLARKTDNNPLNLLRRAADDGNRNPQRRVTGRTNTPRSPERIENLHNGCDPRAQLSSHPRNLHILWDEHIKGLGSCKPARDFTPRERGRVKCKHCNRNHVWRLMCDLMRLGWTASEAMDKIYASFGPNKSVTQIIKAIKNCRKPGNQLPHALRVPAPRDLPGGRRVVRV